MAAAEDAIGRLFRHPREAAASANTPVLRRAARRFVNLDIRQGAPGI
jgi:hypothetical protein